MRFESHHGHWESHPTIFAPVLQRSPSPKAHTEKWRLQTEVSFCGSTMAFNMKLLNIWLLRACPVITYCDVVIMVVSRVSHKTVTHSPFLWYQVQAVPVQYYKLSTMWKFTIFQSLQFSNPVTHQPDGNAKSRTKLNYVSLSSCDFIS